jgi:hypothetical protein
MHDQLWYQLYETAVLELDTKRLKERIDAALAAIDERLLVVPLSPEYYALLDAIRTLEVLRRNEVK